MTDTPGTLEERLLAMYSHRGDGLPTQYVNPDGPDAVEEIASLRARVAEVARELIDALEGDLDWLDALSQMTIERDMAMVRIRAHRTLIAKARALTASNSTAEGDR